MGLQDAMLLVMVVAVFWFVAVRPQQQRAKQQKAMIEALGPGDEIVTVGGIYATVVDMGDRVRVSVADGGELEIAPQAIARVVTAAGADDGEADDGLEAVGEVEADAGTQAAAEVDEDGSAS